MTIWTNYKVKLLCILADTAEYVYLHTGLIQNKAHFKLSGKLYMPSCSERSMLPQHVYNTVK